ncbi:MAG: restriction endonuclease, partial [Sciscionella sp.]
MDTHRRCFCAIQPTQALINPDRPIQRPKNPYENGESRAYYILEAKWYAKTINLDPVAKLEMRLRVRPPGTGGILVSMSGFTAPVYGYTEYHPEILLLDRTHIEAMLTGLLGPERFFHHLVFWT